MYRIAHISDLHIQHEDIEKIETTWLQYLVKILGVVDVDADPHSDECFEALKTKLTEISPDLIVITGDVSNFGVGNSYRGFPTLA